MIKNIIKKSYQDVVANTSIALILVAFMLLFNIVASLASHLANPLAISGFAICLLLLIFCFFSGWFQLFKEVAKSRVEDKKNPFGIFLEGIGINITPVIFGAFLYTILSLLVFLIAGKIAYLVFGSLNFLSEDTIPMLQTPQAYSEYFTNLPHAQKIALTGWLLFNLAAMGLVSFIFMFYPAALVKDEKYETKKELYSGLFSKPFRAFKDSICLIFKNFFEVILLCIPIVLIYALLGILGGLFNTNMVLSLIILFLRIYFICCVIMVVFNYYEAKKQPKDNSDNRADSVGENEADNRISEEN